MPPARVLGDVLILAGDISDGNIDSTIAIASLYRAAGRAVLYVPGNHDYDGRDLAAELWRISRACRRGGIALLHNRAIVIGGVRFAGTTLWTDFELNGSRELSMAVAGSNVSDYALIRLAGAKLRPADTVKFHRKALAFLERTFSTAFEGRSVVITHHAVHPGSVHYSYQGHPLNSSYASDLSDFIARWRPALMIHGHVHNRFDYFAGETRIITNPRGRVTMLLDHHGTSLERPEHDDFDPEFVIDI